MPTEPEVKCPICERPVTRAKSPFLYPYCTDRCFSADYAEPAAPENEEPATTESE